MARITSVQTLPGVRAGSALVRVGERLLLAQDDEYTLVWLHVGADGMATPEFLPLHPQTGAMPKSDKPDFEAATALADGRILIIGSGSAEPRRKAVLLDPVTDEFEMHDAGRIYDLAAAAIGHELNLEGIAPRPGGLRLFHRGNSGDGNATIDLDVDPAHPESASIAGCTRWDIGTVPGESGPVALTYTDAFADEHGSTWFLAAAEDTPNAIDDGPVVGAALGQVSDESGSWTLITEADGSPSVRKAEGLVIDPSGHTAWIVTDPDDEELEAELCVVELRGW